MAKHHEIHDDIHHTILTTLWVICVTRHHIWDSGRHGNSACGSQKQASRLSPSIPRYRIYLYGAGVWDCFDLGIGRRDLIGGRFWIAFHLLLVFSSVRKY